MNDPRPKQGFSDSVDAETYHRRWEEYSATDLKNLLRSPKRMAWGRSGLLEATKAMDLGRLRHVLLFEPGVYGESYAVVPEGMRRDPRTAKYQDFLENEGAGREVITQSEYDEALRVVAAIWKTPIWNTIEGYDGVAERSWWWQDEATGLSCKARTDLWVDLPDRNLIVDLKTTANSSREAFARTAHRLLYHLQVAHYCAGVTAVTGKPCDCLIIAAEYRPPYEVNTYLFASATALTSQMQLGEQVRREALDRLSVCVNYNSYPASNEGKVTVLEPPAFALKDIEDQVFMGGDDDDEAEE